MKVKNYISIVVLILISYSCTNEFDQIDNKNSNFPKYPETVVDITTHNYVPSIAAEVFDSIQSEVFEVPQLRSVTDSVWTGGFGMTRKVVSDESIILPNFQRYTFIGSLLKGSSISDARYEPISASVKPITVSVSFPAKIVSGTIQNPNLSSTREFISYIMDQEGIGTQNGTLYYEIDQFTSYDELKIAFGSNTSTSSLFKRKNSSTYEESFKIEKRTGLYVRFYQRNFSLDMDIPSGGYLINGSLTSSQTGGYDPVYVSSIAYGRMGIFTLETNESFETAKMQMEEIFKTVFYKKQSYMTEEQKRFLSESYSQVYLMGGDGESGLQTIDGYDAFIRHIANGGTFNKMQPGVPIYCSFAYLSDNSPVKIHFNITVETDPLYTRIELGNIRGDSNNQTADAYLCFFHNSTGTTPINPPSMIKFNIRKMITTRTVTPTSDNTIIGPVDNYGEYNLFRETRRLIYKDLPVVRTTTSGNTKKIVTTKLSIPQGCYYKVIN